jgi:predicted nicotinamide N-methyase
MFQFPRVGGDDLCLQMICSDVQEAEADYGLYVWPSGLLLAHYIWRHQSQFASKCILELGCGCGLSGMVAASLGASVVLTDNTAYSHVLQSAENNCKLNGPPHLQQQGTYLVGKGAVTVRGLTWGRFPGHTLTQLPQANLIIAADVFYDTGLFEDVLATVSFLDAPLVTVFQHRGGSERGMLEFLVGRWGLALEAIPYDVREYPLNDVTASLEILLITRKPLLSRPELLTLNASSSDNTVSAPNPLDVNHTV